MATVLWIVHRALGAVIAVVMLALLLCTTLPTFNINNLPVRFPLPGFIYEVHHKYSTPYDTTIAFLKAHAKKNDILYVTPDDALSAYFFNLGDSLIMGSLLTKDYSRLPVDKLRKANYPAYIDEYYPDWIIALRLNQQYFQMLNYFSRGPYAYAMEKNIAIFGGNMTNPELPWHSFVPMKVPENSNDGIFIFKRIDKPGAKKPDSVAAPKTAAPIPLSMSRE